MAQLVDWSLLTLEILGSNPTTSKILSISCIFNRKKLNKRQETNTDPTLENIFDIFPIKLLDTVAFKT